MNNKQEVLCITANPEEIYTFPILHGFVPPFSKIIWNFTENLRSKPAYAQTMTPHTRVRHIGFEFTNKIYQILCLNQGMYKKFKINSLINQNP